MERDYMYWQDCWFMHDWVTQHLGLDEHGATPIRRIELEAMENYARKVMGKPGISADIYAQAKSMRDGIQLAFQTVPAGTSLEYWDSNRNERQRAKQITREEK